MSHTQIGDHTFTITREPVEVTSMSRPDTSWFMVDKKGHMHQWWEEKPFRPADSYSPSKRYLVPSVRSVYVGLEWIGDEEYPVYEQRCRKCGQTVRPGYRSDDYRQFVPGIRSLYIDDQPVTQEEFIRRAIENGVPSSVFDSWKD